MKITAQKCIRQILVVDDDDIDLIQEVNSLVDHSNSFSVTGKESGEEIVDDLRRAQILPDIIISDINMPKISGLELLKEIKADKSLCHIPVIIMSSSSWDQDIFNAKELGAIAFVVKPYTFDGFAALGNIIDKVFSKNAVPFCLNLNKYERIMVT